MIYVHKTASRATTIVAWCSLTFMASYWSWYFLLGGHVVLENLMRPDEGPPPLVASTDDNKAKEDSHAKGTGEHGIKDVKLHVAGMKDKWY
jgi:hypothetical protein